MLQTSAKKPIVVTYVFDSSLTLVITHASFADVYYEHTTTYSMTTNSVLLIDTYTVTSIVEIQDYFGEYICLHGKHVA